MQTFTRDSLENRWNLQKADTNIQLKKILDGEIGTF